MAEEKEKVEEKKGGKKIPFLIPVVLLLLAGAGEGPYFFLLNKSKKEGEEEVEPPHVGIIVDLGVFTVNLADRGTDAYARVAINKRFYSWLASAGVFRLCPFGGSLSTDILSALKPPKGVYNQIQ
jgi:flagellar FliL protein